MKAPEGAGISRRRWLKRLAGLGAGAALSGCSQYRPHSNGAAHQLARRKPDLVRRENQRTGTHEWLLTNTRIDPATKYRCPWIEGYCSRASIRAGEPLSLFVSTNPISEFTIEIYRMGFYGGAGARLVSKLGPFQGRLQPEPAIGRNRIRDRNEGEAY